MKQSPGRLQQLEFAGQLLARRVEQREDSGSLPRLSLEYSAVY